MPDNYDDASSRQRAQSIAAFGVRLGACSIFEYVSRSLAISRESLRYVDTRMYKIYLPRCAEQFEERGPAAGNAEAFVNSLYIVNLIFASKLRVLSKLKFTAEGINRRFCAGITPLASARDEPDSGFTVFRRVHKSAKCLLKQRSCIAALNHVSFSRRRGLLRLSRYLSAGASRGYRRLLTFTRALKFAPAAGVSPR